MLPRALDKSEAAPSIGDLLAETIQDLPKSGEHPIVDLPRPVRPALSLAPITASVRPPPQVIEVPPRSRGEKIAIMSAGLLATVILAFAAFTAVTPPPVVGAYGSSTRPSCESSALLHGGFWACVHDRTGL